MKYSKAWLLGCFAMLLWEHLWNERVWCGEGGWEGGGIILQKPEGNLCMCAFLVRLCTAVRSSRNIFSLCSSPFFLWSSKAAVRWNEERQRRPFGTSSQCVKNGALMDCSCRRVCQWLDLTARQIHISSLVMYCSIFLLVWATLASTNHHNP